VIASSGIVIDGPSFRFFTGSPSLSWRPFVVSGNTSTSNSRELASSQNL